MATITTAGSGNWDAGATWTGGSVPADGDTASISSGHTCTLTENEQVGAVVINGGTIAGGGFKITCVKTSGRLFDHSGTITGNLDVELQGTHTTTEDFMGTGNIRNLILNGSGLNVDIGRATTIAGDLTITQGTLHTNASSNHALTVTGTTTLTGTLNLNGSTASFNSGATAGGVILGTAGYINGDADSTVTMGSISATGTGNRGVSLAGTNTINKYKASDDLIINLMDGTVDGTTLFTVTTPDAKGIALQETTSSLTLNPSSSVIYKLEDTLNVNNLTINSNASLTTLDGSTSRGLVATGDASVTGTLTGNASAISLGSLTINSGGTYSATSGTTTITKNTGATGGVAFYTHTSGTFTHNSGLIKFTSADADTNVVGQSVTKNPFYDLEATSTYEPKEANETTVLNNATFANNVTFQDSARYIKVLGICRFLSGEYNRNNNSTNANHFFGTLIIEGGTFELAPMEITVGSFRNLGGTIS